MLLDCANQRSTKKAKTNTTRRKSQLYFFLWFSLTETAPNSFSFSWSSTATTGPTERQKIDHTEQTRHKSNMAEPREHVRRHRVRHDLFSAQQQSTQHRLHTRSLSTGNVAIVWDGLRNLPTAVPRISQREATQQNNRDVEPRLSTSR